MKYSLGVRIRHDATEIGGGFVCNSCAQHDCLRILVLEQLEHLIERERRADIGIENEEPVRLAFQYDIAEVIQATGSAQCLVFSEVFDAQLWEGGRDVVDERLENGFLVVTDNENLFDLRNTDNGAETVFNDWVTGNREEGLLEGLVG